MNKSLYKGIIYKIYKNANEDKIISMIIEDGLSRKFLLKHLYNKKKYLGVEIGNLIEVNISKNYSIDIIKNLYIMNLFQNWKDDTKSILELNILCEIISIFADYSTENINIYPIVYNCLSIQTKRKRLLVIGIIAKLLDLFGILEEKEYEFTKNLKTEDIRVLKIQKFIINSSFKDILKIRISEIDEKFLFEKYLLYIKEKMSINLKSIQVIEEIIKYI